MKKILLVILIIAACLTFAACDMLPGSGNGSGGSGNGTGGDGQEHTHVAASETVVTKEPTCSEVGSANVVCAECGEVMSTVSVPATGAHVSEVIPAEAPTCTSGGFSEGSKCKNCGKTLEEPKPVEVLGHDFKQTDYVAPTCLEGGRTDYGCTRCDATKSTTGDALGHNGSLTQVEASCTSEGCSYRVCDRCDETYDYTIVSPILNHVYEVYVKEPTCSEYGYTNYTCVNCGDTYGGDSVEPLGHNYVTEVTPPGCTSWGNTLYSCTKCDSFYESDLVAPIGHDYQITVDTEWEKKYVCQNCYDVTFGSKGLNILWWSIDTNIRCVSGIGSCTDNIIVIPEKVDGQTVGRIDEFAFSQGTPIKAISIPTTINYIGACAFSTDADLFVIYYGGSLDQWNAIEKEEYWDSNLRGKYVIYTKFCDENGTDHSWVNASCQSGKHCSVCGEVRSTELGHVYGLELISPTCTEVGYRKYTCERCGDNYNEEIPADGHTKSEWIVEKEPTKTTDGYRIMKCDTCGELLETQVLGAGSQGLKIGYNGYTDTYYVAGIGSCTDTEIVFPKIHEGVVVTEIGNSAFMNNTDITSVVVPEGYTIIDSHAFRNCTSLTSVVVPDSVTELGYFVFADCTALDTVEIGENSKLSVIGIWAFDSCNSLEKIYLPSSLKHINNYAFNNTGLTEINLPDGLEIICDSAFSDCEKLSRVKIPGSVTTLGERVFYDCNLLTEAEYGNGITETGVGIFYQCYKLERVIIPASITTISTNSFGNCESLKYIDYYGTTAGWAAIEMDEDWAKYYAADRLTIKYCTEVGVEHNWVEATCKAPKHCTGCSLTIGDNGDHNLTYSHTQKPTCNKDGYDVYNCSSCGVNFAGETIPALGGEHNYNVTDTMDPTCLEDGYIVYVCDRCEDSYTTWINHLGHNMDEEVMTVKPTCGSIGYTIAHCSRCDSDFYLEIVDALGGTCEYIEEVIAPDCQNLGYTIYTCSKCGYSYIDNYVDPSDHAWVTEVIAPTCTESGYSIDTCSVCDAWVKYDVVDPLGNHSFEEKVISEPTLTEDGEKKKTCTACGYIETVVLGAGSQGLDFSITEDGYSAILNGIGTCTDTDIIIPGIYEGVPVRDIGYMALDDITTITSITIPASVWNIATGPFKGCTSLQNIYVEEGNENYLSIDGNLYTSKWGDGLWLVRYAIGKTDADYVTPENVVRIGSYAFTYSNIKNVVLGDSVKVIDSYAFSISRSLEYVEIGDSVTTINYHAFFHAGSLATVVMGKSVETIGGGAFSCCSELKNIELPDSLTTIGEEAFAYCFELTSINIPASVTSIGAGVFRGSYSLTDVTVDEDNPNYCSIDGGLYSKDTTVLLHYPVGANKSVTIPSHVTTISCQFINSDVIFVTIPNSVTRIDDNAFTYCECLNYISYTGTETQWNEIDKAANWGNVKVKCIDGWI